MLLPGFGKAFPAKEHALIPSPFSRRPYSGPWPLAGLLLLAALLASPPAGAAFALQDSGQWFGEALSEDATLADLDGDGDTDAFVTNDGANTVWINQGGAQGGTQGDFPNTGQPLGSANSSAVALADLDGDGDTDAFVANGGANAVWVNQGGGQGGTAGEFASGPSLGSASSLGVALADLDGDGDTDAFVANQLANRVWLNDGSGTFTDSGQALGSGSSFGVALADLDGDGDQDAFVANFKTLRVWLNHRPGLLRFSAPGYAAAESDGSATITVRRIRGADGAAEVAYATADGTAVAVSDYTTATGTLSWADGEAAGRTFTVAITDEAEGEGEGDETVNLALSSPAGDGSVPEPEVGSPGAATLTLTDNDPSLTGGTGSFDLAEDAAVGTTVTTLTASDPDGDSLTFAITVGNGGGKFAVDAATGEITVAEALDYETTTSYGLTVEVADGSGGSDSGTVTVNVTDAAEGSGGSGGGGGCALDPNGSRHPGLPLLLALLGAAGLLRRGPRA